MEVKDNPSKSQPEAADESGFCEGIFELINAVEVISDDNRLSRALTPEIQLFMCSRVILKIGVSKNHDAIIATWTAQCNKYWIKEGQQDWGITQYLRASKAAAESRPQEAQGTTDEA